MSHFTPITRNFTISCWNQQKDQGRKVPCQNLERQFRINRTPLSHFLPPSPSPPKSSAIRNKTPRDYSIIQSLNFVEPNQTPIGPQWPNCGLNTDGRCFISTSLHRIVNFYCGIISLIQTIDLQLF